MIRFSLFREYKRTNLFAEFVDGKGEFGQSNVRELAGQVILAHSLPSQGKEEGVSCMRGRRRKRRENLHG